MLTETTRLRDFPSLAGITYLNTAAENIPPLCVGAALRTYFEDKQRGMAGRIEHFAQVEACREVSARLLRLQPAEVAFCSCSSEAYNLLASALQLGTDDEVVVTDLDFPAGATPWLRAAQPPTVRLWKSQDGVLPLETLAPLLGERTRLVQVSLVSFYNGHRISWPAFRRMVRERAPQAVISVDITQAFGRVPLDCDGADILISSTHKWTLGIHGGCVVGVPTSNAARLTTHAGGWLHLENAFAANRFEHAVPKAGAASFSVGMPSFGPLYALNAALRYLETIGIAQIAAHANPLTAFVDASLRDLGLKPLGPWDPQNPTGIVAFQHARSVEIHARLLSEQVHVMHNAGRIRIAVHGYNTPSDIEHALQVLKEILRSI
jgi:selenocysteine lyase/cysteine desulfurase